MCGRGYPWGLSASQVLVEGAGLVERDEDVHGDVDEEEEEIYLRAGDWLKRPGWWQCGCE